MKILVVAQGTYGDVFPMVAVAETLHKNGYDVTLACERDFIERLEPYGVPLFGHLNGIYSKVHELKFDGTTDKVLELVSDKSTEGYELLKQLHIDNNFDLIIRHFFEMCAIVLAKEHNIPYVNCFISGASFLSRFDPPYYDEVWYYNMLVRMPFINKFLKGITNMIFGRHVNKYKALCKEKGVDDTLPFFEISPYKNLLLTSKYLFLPQPDWPENIEIIGYPFLTQSVYNQDVEDITLDWIKDGNRKPIIVTLGSSGLDNEVEIYTDMLHTLEYEFPDDDVLIITHKDIIQQLHSNTALIVDRVNYEKVFPYASIVIHQGGMGTTMEALRAGVPQIIISKYADRPDNAKRVENLDVGMYLPNPSDEELKDAILYLTEDDVTTNAKLLAKNISLNNWQEKLINAIASV